MGSYTNMPTREENRQPNEVALFRSLDPVYGYGTKPDFDAYFAKHGYAYGSAFGPSNTPSLPYPNYETRDVPHGSYHRPGCYSLGYGAGTTYGRHGPHFGAVVSPESFPVHPGYASLQHWGPRHYHHYGMTGHPGYHGY